MDISGLTAVQKSVMLAQLVGWQVFAYANGEYSIDTGQYRVSIREHHTLYTPTKMMFAWMVLNWAMSSFEEIESKTMPGLTYASKLRESVIGRTTFRYALWSLPPAEAQAAWLDKVLELAVAAGLVDAA